jgi:hypothetical protein
MVAGVVQPFILVDVGQEETLEPSSNIKIQRNNYYLAGHKCASSDLIKGRQKQNSHHF